MFEFTSLSKFKIKGRGTVYVVENPLPCKREDILYYLQAEGVSIDGVEYEPLGVETASLATPLRVGEHIGILVSK